MMHRNRSFDLERATIPTNHRLDFFLEHLATFEKNVMSLIYHKAGHFDKKYKNVLPTENPKIQTSIWK